MFLIALAVASATLLITLAWKISTHAAGIAGPTTALIFVFGPWVLPLYFLSALMIWARVKLSAHTEPGDWAGLVLSITVTSLVYLVFYP